MRLSNKSIGTEFENQLTQTLGENGYWVHMFQQKACGQPVDIIAGKNGCVTLIDCKHCSRLSFDMKNIQYNQDLSASRWERCVNMYAYFALLLPDGEIWMLEHKLLLALREQGIKILNHDAITEYGVKLNDWLQNPENGAD